uniref:Uncharacterized protein n=1 Tax=Aegilops tauschii subsp. strangulata TaxID=200361 RepID=A0A453SZP3_AEGTS
KSYREGLMSPQTETKAGVGFQAGVKDYKLTYYTLLFDPFCLSRLVGAFGAIWIKETICALWSTFG